MNRFVTLPTTLSTIRRLANRRSFSNDMGDSGHIVKISPFKHGSVLPSSIETSRHTKMQHAPIRQLPGIAILDRAFCERIKENF